MFTLVDVSLAVCCRCVLNTSTLVVSENDGVPLVQYLPCGGSADVMSVYSSAGPYLYNLSSFVATPAIDVDDAFIFSVVLSFAGPPGMPLGKCSLQWFVIYHPSFIPAISIAPLQVLYYSEALPTTARILYRSFTPKRTGNCR